MPPRRKLVEAIARAEADHVTSVGSQDGGIYINKAEGDTGRKGKQLCLITTDGQPCGGCTARKQECTFNLPPLRRHRKHESGSPEQQQLRDTSPTRVEGAGQDTPSVLFDMMEGSQLNLAEGSADWVAPHGHQPMPIGWDSINPGPSVQPTLSTNDTSGSTANLPVSDPAFMLPGQHQASAEIWALRRIC